MSDVLTQLYEKAHRATAKPGNSEQQNTQIEQHWDAIHGHEFDPTNPRNFEPFLAERITDLHKRTQPEDRVENLCGTSNQLCAVLHGEVPVELCSARGRLGQTAITPAEARSYVSRHPKCHAVSTALSEWDAGVRDVKRHLRQIVQIGFQSGSGNTIKTGNIPGAGGD
jgi:hypothetical protein